MLRTVAGVALALGLCGVATGGGAPAGTVLAAGNVSVPCPDVTGGRVSIGEILAVPEQDRAACFGSTTLTFHAWGWTLMNLWPGINVAEALGPDFVLSEHQDTMSPSLTAFLPPVVVLPAAAGTPWRDYDGIPPGFAWFAVSGRFNAPASAQCTPREGDTIDGVPVVVTPAEAVAFCRNHFTITVLAWEPDHAGARTAEPWVGPDATATVPGSEPEPTPSASPAGTSADVSASPVAQASSPASSQPSLAGTPEPSPAVARQDPRAPGAPPLPVLLLAPITAAALWAWLLVRRQRRRPGP